jgi:lysophospholipase L1-like esterase
MLRAITPAVLLLVSCAPLPINAVSKLPVGGRYVALGSSFASGPGVTQLADDRDPRCTRSNDNYPRQLARRLKLELVDVSCGGATTQHVLTGWNELLPQIDALTADTQLVTVTIGGNDVGYIGQLFAGSCGTDAAATDASKAACAGFRARASSAPSASQPFVSDEAKWSAAEAGLSTIAAEVSRHSPRARLVFVEYLTVVPSSKPCDAIPLSEKAAQQGRDTAARLARLTQQVALRSGAEFLPVASLSQGHDACAKAPWVTGFVPAVPASGKPFVPYHPNLDGMTAVADALVAKLK